MVEPIKIPLVNPNEPESILVGLYVTEGGSISHGDVICSLETTKSTIEIRAEDSGFIVGIHFKEGDTLQVGDILCYIADAPDWIPPMRSEVETVRDNMVRIPKGLRITKPALNLAERHDVNLSVFPVEMLITEKVIRENLQKRQREVDLVDDVMSSPTRSGASHLNEVGFDPTAILIYGGGGHGKSVLELLNTLGRYFITGFIDDGLSQGERIMGLPVLGDKEILKDLHRDGVRLAVNAVGGIGNVRVRERVFGRLIQCGFNFPTIVHPRAFIETSADLSPGVQVFPLAYVGSEVVVGFGSIINTGAIVSHECEVGDIANVSPGAVLAGGVRVGEGALIGMGVTVNLGVRIGAGAKVGNGATVKADIPEGGIVQAGRIWPG